MCTNDLQLAAIDIGTNAIRLLINQVSTNSRTQETKFRKITLIRVPTRLGTDVFMDGKIGEEKKEQLFEALKGFKHIMKAFEVEHYKAYATSAMREAENGKLLVEQIAKTIGVNVEIISGEKEANTIYDASESKGIIDKHKCYLYIDVGGGSTEVVVYKSGEKLVRFSFQLGTVRLLAGKVKEEELERFKLELQRIYEKYAPESIVGSGGNINKTHKLLDKKPQEPLTYKEIKKLYKQAIEMTFEERMKKMQINAYRADVIVHALNIFCIAAKKCHINAIIVPRVGLSDGIIQQLYTEKSKSLNK